MGLCPNNHTYMLSTIDITILCTGAILYKGSCNVSMPEIYCYCLIFMCMPDAYESMTSHINYLLPELNVSSLQDLSCTLHIVSCTSIEKKKIKKKQYLITKQLFISDALQLNKKPSRIRGITDDICVGSSFSCQCPWLV